MSNKDVKVINLTAEEIENNEANNTNEFCERNENNEANNTNEFCERNENNEANNTNEFCERNESLIAERDILMKRVKELEEKLEETSATNTRMFGYWQREEKKVQLLVSIIKTGIKGTDYMTAAEFVEKIIEEI